jgi:hypothetical protein
MRITSHRGFVVPGASGALPLSRTRLTAPVPHQSVVPGSVVEPRVAPERVPFRSLAERVTCAVRRV